MKTLRENDSGYRIEPVGLGFEIWVNTKMEKDSDYIRKEPNGLRWAVKLPINILASLMIVDSHGVNFTLVARMQPFYKV